MRILSVPFPRPKSTIKNIFWVFLIALTSTAFILVFKPFNIQNQNEELYYYALLVSMGCVFFLSICFIEFFIPSLVPKLFKKWTVLKAIIWYLGVILFVSIIMFLYKSYLGGFVDFTLREYINVTGRVLGIAIIVSFFVFGISKYFNKKNFAFLSANQEYHITAINDQPICLNPKDILYIVSDNNYVDIHIISKGKRDKLIFRSSLKNIESQIVTPLTTIYRCHRRYLINIACFKLKNTSSRQTTIELEKYEDEIPVSSKYVDEIISLL